MKLSTDTTTSLWNIARRAARLDKNYHPSQRDEKSSLFLAAVNIAQDHDITAAEALFASDLVQYIDRIGY